ncbi:MAG: diacylglycerol kinase family lipid kinase [Planctomycetota bacterium]
MPRRVLILANPIAGGGRARALAPALERELASRGHAAEVRFTQRSGDAGAWAGRARREGFDALAALGGDGTVNEIANGMLDLDVPVGVLPLGTANVLATELRLPRRPEGLADLVTADRRTRLAVARAGERRFLLFCGAGVDGAMAHRLARTRTGTLGKHKWIGPAFSVLRDWPRLDLCASFPDGERIGGCSSILVTRVRNYGGLFRLTKDIDVRDGLLHVLCFRHESRTAYAGAALAALLGVLAPSRRLLVRSCRAVRVGGDGAPCQIDGEAGGTAPVDIGIEDGTLEVFAP